MHDDIARRNAEMAEYYLAIMDGASIDGSIDADAQREVREWLQSRCQGTDTGPINISVANGDADSIARGIGDSLRRYFERSLNQKPPPTHAKPLPAQALRGRPPRKQ